MVNTIPDRAVQRLLDSQQQLELVTKFASTLLKVTNSDIFLTHIKKTLLELGLNGSFQIKLETGKQINKFGKPIDISRLGKMPCLKAYSEKIYRRDNYMVFCFNHFILILELSNLLAEQLDDTQNNLALFCELCDSWIVNHFEARRLIASTKLYKQDMLDKINELNFNLAPSSADIKMQYLEVSQGLLLMLASRFPLLCLGEEQEEEALDCLEQTIDVYTKLIHHLPSVNDSPH